MKEPLNEPDPDPDDGGDDEPSPTRVMSAESMESMTKEQLLNYASSLGIGDVNGNMKKADIISAISEA